MKFRRTLLLIVLITLVGFPLTTFNKIYAELPNPVENQTAGPDFSKLVFIGDSLTAGFQSRALFEDGQLAGYANLFAKQVGAKVTLPLISNPGLPANGQLSLSKSICDSKFPLGFLNLGNVSGVGTRTNITEQVTDLAVPGQTVDNALTLKPTPITDPSKANLTDVILGLPGLISSPPVAKSQIEWAEALKPSFLVIWVGNNDALGAVLNGGTKGLTLVKDFKSRYSELLTRAKATGATVVVANIPDVTSIPLLLSVDQVVQAGGGKITKQTLKLIFGVNGQDFILPTALSLLSKGKKKLPNNQVLTKKEIKTIRSTVDEFNKIISDQAKEKGAILVDFNKLLLDIKTNGVTIDGVGKLTSGYFGGLFSLDGIHPSSTGQAIAANGVIGTINAVLKSNIPFVDVKAVALTDKLVCSSGGNFDGNLTSPTLEDYERLNSIFEQTQRLLSDPSYPVLQ